MLHFDCPHCGNHLRLEDEFAGRDGWCRACKGMIVAPSPGEISPTIESLRIEARYDRLYQLFRFAATKADNYKLLLGRLRNQRDALTKELAKAGKWRDSLAELQRQVDAAQRLLAARDDELAAAAEARRNHESEAAALRLECETLQNAVAERTIDQSESRRLAELHDHLAAANQKVDKLHESLALLTLERDSSTTELHESQRTVTDLETRLRDANEQRIQGKHKQSELETTCGELHAEIDRLQHQLIDHQLRLSSLGESHERDLRDRERDITRLQERLDTAGETVSDEVRELEESLRRFRCQAQTDAERIRILEQELLGASDHASKFEHALQASTEIVERIEDEKRRLIEDIQRSEADLQATLRTHHELTETHHAVQQERDAARTEAAKLADEVEQLRSRLETLNEEVQQARAENAQAATTLQESAERLRDAQRAHADLVTAMERRTHEPEPGPDNEHAAELGSLQHEIDRLQADYETLREDYAMLEQEYEALQEERDIPSFGILPEERDSEILSAMPPVPPDPTRADDHVIIPEIVMDEPDRPDPMVDALLRFMNKERENDEVG